MESCRCVPALHCSSCSQAGPVQEACDLCCSCLPKCSEVRGSSSNQNAASLFLIVGKQWHTSGTPVQAAPTMTAKLSPTGQIQQVRYRCKAVMVHQFIMEVQLRWCLCIKLQYLRFACVSTTASAAAACWSCRDCTTGRMTYPAMLQRCAAVSAQKVWLRESRQRNRTADCPIA